MPAPRQSAVTVTLPLDVAAELLSVLIVRLAAIKVVDREDHRALALANEARRALEQAIDGSRQRR